MSIILFPHFLYSSSDSFHLVWLFHLPIFLEIDARIPWPWHFKHMVTASNSRLSKTLDTKSHKFIDLKKIQLYQIDNQYFL